MQSAIGTKAKVLYIEDDNDSQRLVQRILGQCGYEVLVAHDGLEGVTLARETNPQLVLMDLNLPRLDGHTVTTRLRSLPSLEDIPIVALTANNSAGTREMALAAGCIGFLSKPIDVDTFPQQVASFLEGRKHTLKEEVRWQHLERHTQQVVIQLETKVRELEEFYNRLYKLDRMKSDFITLASHELRTPMALISGYANLLEKQLAKVTDLEQITEIMDVAGRMNKGVGRMQEVVEGIIRVAHTASGALNLDLAPVKLARMINSLILRFADICSQRSLTLHVASFTDFPSIYADRLQLQTAVGHIIENAIKFTPDGGDIYIGGYTVEAGVVITIRDTGVGIPVSEQKQIFEQFYTLGNIEHHSSSRVAFQGGGMGLGLTVAKGIVEAHFGRIWAESDSQDFDSLPGTTFHILLPLMPPTQEQKD